MLAGRDNGGSTKAYSPVCCEQNHRAGTGERRMKEYFNHGIKVLSDDKDMKQMFKDLQKMQKELEALKKSTDALVKKINTFS
ncbi:hypothetical protein [Paenibacillus cremeus]|uniref:Uncharacterized protein n=1 Tax=Paenibacillus cremeus TaxID=2163881 RepID=A0A559KFK0_9BACL|nr:hypothetical protein [Paenibacillus cremeus]TVY10896.1 hypothetical protein FPZ49_05285 [Paenibacillus cremeus]